MAKSATERFATARALAESLQRALKDSPGDSRNGAATRQLPNVVPAPAAPKRPARAGRGRLPLVLAAAIGLAVGGAAAASIAILASDDPTNAPPAATGETSPGATTEGPAALNAFDNDLLPHVPDTLQASCRHASPITADFDSTLACRPGGVVSSLTYSHARSGFLLFNYFVSGMTEAGLPTPPTERAPPLIGRCSTGDVPSVNPTVAVGLRGRKELPERVTRDERLGLIRCYESGDEARIEWTTSELGVYAVATGQDLAGLYDWWRTSAGPEA